MRSAAVTRIAADLCFFFSLLCLFSPVSPLLWLLGVFLAACLLFGALALRTERRWLRLPLLLPPLALLLLAPDALTLAALGVGWVYAALLLVSDRAGMEYWSYRRFFLVMAAATILISLYVAGAKVLTVVTPAGVLLFAGLFLLLGMHTLRSLRMGSAVDPLWTVWSVLELLVPPALGAGVFALLSGLSRYVGAAMEILIYPFAQLLRLYSELMSRLFPEDFDTGIQEITEIAPMDYLESAEAAAEAQPTPTPAPVLLPAGRPFPWREVLIALAVLAFLVLLVRYLLRGRKVKNAPSALLHEERFRPQKRRRKRAAATDPAARVRQSYQSYLMVLQLHGSPVRESETSQDILMAQEKSGVLEAERYLRELYLAARYGDAGQLTTEDAEAAERCLEEIRSQATNNK